MKQKARKSIPAQKSTTTTATKPSGVSTSVHPCFYCGFIFARKQEFVSHMDKYHRRPVEASGPSRCRECNQDFHNDDKALKEHLLFHDLAKVITALRCSEMRKKRMQPVVLRTPMIDTTTFRREESAVKQEQYSPLSSSGKMKGRQKSKGIFVPPGAPSEETVSPAPATTPMPPPAPVVLSPDVNSSPTEPTRKRRRLSNEPHTPGASPVKAMEVVSPSTHIVPVPSTPPQVSSVPVEGSPSTSDQKQAVASSVTASPIDLTTTTTIRSPQPPTAAQKPTPTLQSECPNCGQNLGKPWHLVDHMIQHQDVQLLRLHRTLKKPEGTGGITTTIPQPFNDRQCTFCQLTHADTQACLLHIVRTHRSRLFECPDNGECILTCDLMSSIGNDTVPKKFTIRVTVKRKTAE